jgi:hypothetical protein
VKVRAVEPLFPGQEGWRFPARIESSLRDPATPEGEVWLSVRDPLAGAGWIALHGGVMARAGLREALEELPLVSLPVGAKPSGEPDLQPVAEPLAAFGASCVPGEPVENAYAVNLYNVYDVDTGGSPAPTSVQFEITPPSGTPQRITIEWTRRIEAGETVNIIVAAPGTRVTVDPDNGVPETDETNNTILLAALDLECVPS